MRTKRYWTNRYMNFIEKVLEKEISRNASLAGLFREEAQDYIESDLPDIKENPQDAKEIVIFLSINHQLNLLDPIGCCYPGIRYEYGSYARNMVELFFENQNKEVFSKKLRRELIKMWECVASNPRRDKKIINRGCGKIVYILYNILLKGTENHGDNFSEENHWLKQFYLFISNVILRESMQYKHKAILVQEEVDLLKEEKEKNFKKYEENLDGFIYFLYVNHELNLLDPIGRYYPGLTYPHEKYAWEIVDAYKQNEDDNFINKTENIINNMYDHLVCDVNKSKRAIKYTIIKIEKTLELLDNWSLNGYRQLDSKVYWAL